MSMLGQCSVVWGRMKEQLHLVRKLQRRRVLLSMTRDAVVRWRRWRHDGRAEDAQGGGLVLSWCWCRSSRFAREARRAAAGGQWRAMAVQGPPAVVMGGRRLKKPTERSPQETRTCRCLLVECATVKLASARFPHPHTHTHSSPRGTPTIATLIARRRVQALEHRVCSYTAAHTQSRFPATFQARAHAPIRRLAHPIPNR